MLEVITQSESNTYRHDNKGQTVFTTKITWIPLSGAYDAQ